MIGSHIMRTFEHRLALIHAPVAPVPPSCPQLDTPRRTGVKTLSRQLSLRGSIMLLMIGLVIGSTALPTSLYGQGIQRKQTSVGVTERKREKGSGQPQRKMPRIDRAALIASTVETRLIKGIDKTLRQMRSISSKLPKGSEKKLEVLKRMLQLQLEQAAYITSQEYEKYERQWQAWASRGQKGVEPKISHAKSNKMWLKFIRLSGEVVREFPKSKRLDTIMYNQALGLQFVGEEDRAARLLTQLIQKFPNSSIAGDAYHSLGDYHFTKNDFRKARSSYEKVIGTYKSSQRYLWSLFKLGWTHYNLENYRRALTYWKQTISRSASGSKSAQLLREEALRDIVYAFAEIGNINEALSYFRSNGGAEYVGKFLKLLATLLTDQGKFRKAIEVLRKLQTSAPRSEEAPEAQVSIIILTYELGNYNNLWRELRSYATRYGEQSPWARAQKDRAIVVETQKSIRDLLLYYAKLTHRNAQKSENSKALMDEAEKGYLLYLSFYAKTPQAIEVRFNLADLHYFRKSYGKAGRLYLEVATLGKEKAVLAGKLAGKKGEPKKNIHKDAASYMLDSFYKDFEPELKKILAQKKPPDLNQPKKPLSTKASNFIKACGSYLKWYPNDQKIKKNCNVYIAETYYRHNDTKNARTYLWVVARKYPNSKEGKKAVTSLIPLYKNDRKSLNLALIELLKIEAYSKGEIGKKLTGLLRGVDEETVNKEKDLKARAKGFLALAKRYPNSPDVYKYYYNAAVTFVAAGDFLSAMKADKIVASKHASAPVAQDSLLRLAELSATMIEYEQSLGYYKLYLKRYPKSPKYKDVVNQVCDLSIIITHNPQQIINNCQPLRSIDGAAYISRIEDIIATVYARREFGSLGPVITFYLKLPGLSAAQKVRAFYKSYVASGKKGGANNPHAREIGALYGSARASVASDPLALRAVGEVAFQRSMAVMRQFEKIKLRGGTLPAMEASIGKKTQGLNAVENAFAQVISVQDAYWGIAAQYQVGRAYELVGEAYANPPGIKGAKIEDVKKQLAPLSKAAFKKAQGFFTKAQKDSERFNIYSEYSRLIAEALQRRNNRGLTTQDWVLMPDFLGSPISQNLSEELR